MSRKKIIPLLVLILIVITLLGVLFFISLTKKVSLPQPFIEGKNLITVIFPSLNTSTPTPTLKPKVTITLTPNLHVFMTFYGWADNDPPSKNIAYPHSLVKETLHNQAGGVGAFTDPVTIAVKEGRFTPGTKIYIPVLKKYGIVEDICANCVSNQIDVWMDSDSSFKKELLSCERKWTKDSIGIETNPQENRPVSTTPFFVISTGKCN